MKFSARVYVEKLRLNPRQAVHVIPCPFHPDERPSMSINLVKAVHYCHGGCGAPKGGGPLQFLMKWCRIVDRKPIDASEARSRLRSEFRLTDARTQLIAHMTEEVQLFMVYATPRFAEWSKRLERAIADVTAYCAEHAVDDELWDMLAGLHRELAWSDHALAFCTRRLTPATVPTVIGLYRECERRGWWNPEIALTRDDAQQRERMLVRQLEASCHESLFPSIRHPVPRRTPVR